MAGHKPIIIEQGEEAFKRARRVFRYWQSGVLHPFSNVQFGEGGAGTFSDGKLLTGIKSDTLREVLESFVIFGADPKILYTAKPHLGTDSLAHILVNIRQKLIELGASIYFRTELIDITVNDDNELESLILEKWSEDNIENRERIELPCRYLILAPGHSSRNLYYKLAKTKLNMSAKNMAMGLRIEHQQKWLNNIQYGETCYLNFAKNLPAAAYKITNQNRDHRAVYSFCMCPGGMIVGAASGHEQILTNGMSRKNRKTKFANAALLVNVSTDDFKNFFKENQNTDNHILKEWARRVKEYPCLVGIFMQQTLESRAYF